MVIDSAEILVKLSETAGPGNTNAGTPSGSLGGFISTTELVSASLHNLFDQVSGTENTAQESEYRCIFIHNSNATDDFLNIKVYITSEVADGANAEIGVDSTVASPVGSTTEQAVTVANEDTAPASVTFSAPTTSDAAIAVGDLAPGEVRAVWVKRTTANSSALANDGVTLRVQGESI